MDNVLVDFPSGIQQLDEQSVQDFEGRLDEVPGIFALMNPIEDAIESYEKLSKLFDTYILSTAPWNNSSAWSDKIDWVRMHLGEVAYKRLILSHHKNLNDGHFLIDDRLKNGVESFRGEHIHFGTDDFPDWNRVVTYLEIKAK